MDVEDFDIAVFDMDGTLYSTDMSVVPAVMDTFRELGIPEPPVDEIEDLIGRPDVHYHEWLRERAGPDLGDRVVEMVSAREEELVGIDGRLYPRARETLLGLRRLGCRTALLTNAGRSYCAMVLRTFDLTGLFDEVRWYEVGEGSKTERLLSIIEDLGGGAAIMVGDRFYDFEAAREAGCTSVGVSHGFGNEELGAADVVVEGLWAIVELKLRATTRRLEGP